ncbi:MAG: DUF5916 domain-containing protein [Planctomycetota bacterium]
MRRSLWVSCLVLSLGTSAWTQEEAPRVAGVTRVAEPPRLDGLLDDAVWLEAEPLVDFYQVLPIEGAEPSESTEVRIVYTEDALYIGTMCHDPEPEKIVATQMARDADLDPDDRIELFLDTFLDRRNAFYFQISPGGSIGDALFSNAEGFNKRWDGIWWGEARILENGWSCEIEIPFKTLSFDPSKDSWGFNIAREIKRKGERIRWSNPLRSSRFFRVAEGGTIRGFEDLRQGIGLDVVPYGLMKTVHDDRTGRDFLRGDFGGDLFYRVTPSLQASLTLNTDFAEAEVDERQVNLTRFPLFFPERRDFFLQDASIFSFGGISRSPLPFFSRRIGLVSGEEVPIWAGAKLTGRVGDFNLGVLDVQTGEEDGLDPKNLFVTRVSRNVLEESSVGMIFTRGRPAENGENALAGLDFTYRTGELFGEKNFQIDLWGMGTSTSGAGGDGSAAGLTADFPNDQIDVGFEVQLIGDDFNPELGFVQRTGVNLYGLDLEYKPRPETWIRQFTFGFFPDWTTLSNNDLDTRSLALVPFAVELETGDELELRVTSLFERFYQDFEIQDGVIVPADDYEYTRYEARFESSNRRPLSLILFAADGTFLSGRRTDFEVGFEWRPSRYFTIGFEQEENRVSLDEGSFTTRILRGRLDVAFDPRLTWRNFVQYDNVSDDISLNSRVRWIIDPGSELFVVLNQGWRRRGHEIAPFRTDVTVKLVWTFRF